jgi:hypothetical protein
MAGIDLSTAQTHLQTWLSAETAVALGQSFAHEGHQLTRADLNAIRLQIDYWNTHVQRLSRNDGRGGPSAQRIILHG